MSVQLPRELFNVELVKKVKDELLIKKKETMQFGSFGTVTDTVVRCFETSSDGKTIYLPHDYAIQLFPEQCRQDLIRELPKNLALNATPNLRDNQKIIANQALQFLRSRGTVFLNCFPGLGKTRLFVTLSCFLKYKMVLLSTQEILHNQAANNFEELSNAKCCFLSKLKTEMNQETFDKYDVFITTEKSAHKMGAFADQIGTMIVDECHEFCSASRISSLLLFRPKFIIMCSATLHFRRDNLENCIYSIIGKDTCITRRFERSFHVFKFLTYVSVTEKKTRYGQMDFTGMVQELYANEKRNQCVLDWVKINMGNNHKIMVLTVYREHATTLHNMICEQVYPQASLLMGGIRKYIDSRILVGTFSKIGTGFDAASSAEEWDGIHFDLLLLVATTKQMGWLEQLCGRVFRAEMPVIVDFADNQGIFMAHSKIRDKWYKMFPLAKVLQCQVPMNVSETLLTLGQ
jgi:superfamily II DNA or RNA helicase